LFQRLAVAAKDTAGNDSCRTFCADNGYFIACLKTLVTNGTFFDAIDLAGILRYE